MEEIEIVELHPGWVVDPGVPEPVLIQSEHDAAVVFGTTDRRVVVVFEDCAVAQFGYPNDEALVGHTLYTRGLRHYACYEVLNSPWPVTLEEQNRVTFPGSRVFRNGRHFIITFHDSTFECLARALVWRWVDEPLERVVSAFLSGTLLPD